MNEDKLEKLITESLSEVGKRIKPPRELLSRILIAAKSPAVSAHREYFIFSRNFFYAAGFSAILIMAVFSFSSGFGFFHQSAELADQNINNNQPLTSDDIDGAANAILASADDEDSALQSDVDNESSPNDDGGAIKNLIQNYAQDQF